MIELKDKRPIQNKKREIYSILVVEKEHICWQWSQLSK
jgi:hypothetical protein